MKKINIMDFDSYDEYQAEVQKTQKTQITEEHEPEFDNDSFQDTVDSIFDNRP
jgi:hypothetical protein